MEFFGIFSVKSLMLLYGGIRRKSVLYPKRSGLGIHYFFFSTVAAFQIRSGAALHGLLFCLATIEKTGALIFPKFFASGITRREPG